MEGINANLSGYEVSIEDLYRHWWHGVPSAINPSDFYMNGASGAAQKWINFYNPDDIATNQSWRLNNLNKHFINQANPQLPFPEIVDNIGNLLGHDLSSLGVQFIMPPSEV
ncbi:MAG: hypothetical protein AAGA30_02375 [Planctomycetota bacterium]